MIRRGNKNANHKKTSANSNIYFNAKNNVIKFIEDYGSMILEAKKLAEQTKPPETDRDNNSNELIN